MIKAHSMRARLIAVVGVALTVFCAGLLGAPQRALAALRCSFVQIYGMTESNGAVCYLTPTDHTAGDEQLLKSCGRPLPAIDLRILNAQGQEAATALSRIHLAMNRLICIPTCWKYWSRADLIRQTWGPLCKEHGFDLKFFLGRQPGVHTMEMRVFPDDVGHRFRNEVGH